MNSLIDLSKGPGECDCSPFPTQMAKPSESRTRFRSGGSELNTSRRSLEVELLPLEAADTRHDRRTTASTDEVRHWGPKLILRINPGFALYVFPFSHTDVAIIIESHVRARENSLTLLPLTNED